METAGIVLLVLGGVVHWWWLANTGNALGALAAQGPTGGQIAAILLVGGAVTLTIGIGAKGLLWAVGAWFGSSILAGLGSPI